MAQLRKVREKRRLSYIDKILNIKDCLNLFSHLRRIKNMNIDIK